MIDLLTLDPKRSGKCPVCGGEDIRTKFSDTPHPIAWCPDCMSGLGLPNGPAVDMRLFQSAKAQRDEIMRLRKGEAQ